MDDSIDLIIDFIYETVEDTTLWPVIERSLNNNYWNESLAIKGDSEEEIKNNNRLELHEDELLLAKNSLEDNSSKQLLKKIIPHFQRSLYFNQKISRLEEYADNTQHILNQLPIGMLTVDVLGNIVGKNTFADQLLLSESPIFERENKLAGDTQRTTRLLLDIISKVLSGSLTHHSINLPYKDNALNLSIIILPVSKDDNCQYEHCNLLIAAPYHRKISSPEALQEFYGLTTAESNTVYNLINGLSVDEISQTLTITQNTVRAHLKSTFSKTQTHSQVELIRLILQGPTIFFRSQHNEKLPLHKKKQEKKRQFQDIIYLRDGRRMGFSCYGCLHGEPVVFFHGSFGSRLQHPGSVELYEELGVTLIVPDRPGYGLSDSVNDATFISYSDDIHELLRYLHYDEAYFLGYSNGGVYAQAVAHYRPQLCLGMSLVSSMAPFSSIKELEGMKPASFKLGLALARHTPSIIEPIYKLFSRGILANPDKFFSNVTSYLPASDKSLLKSRPEVVNQFIECYKESLRFSVSGVVHDMQLISSDWSFSMQDVPTKTTIWHGVADTYAPINLAEKLSSIPGSKCILLKDKGHMLIFNECEQILISLVGRKPPAPNKKIKQVKMHYPNG